MSFTTAPYLLQQRNLLFSECLSETGKEAYEVNMLSERCKL
jgi:hypothetical protein